MKKKLLTLLLILPFHVQAGDKVGNGGDWSSDQDPMYGAEELKENLEDARTRVKVALEQLQYYVNRTPDVFDGRPPAMQDLKAFFAVARKMVDESKIEVTGEDICIPQGSVCRPADATNIPATKTIRFNVQRARILSKANLSKLLLHENLGLAGFEKSFEYASTKFLDSFILDAWTREIDMITKESDYFGIANLFGRMTARLMMDENGNCRVFSRVIETGYDRAPTARIICLDRPAYVESEIPGMGKSKRAPYPGMAWGSYYLNAQRIPISVATMSNRPSKVPQVGTKKRLFYPDEPIFYSGPSTLTVYDQNTGKKLFSYEQNNGQGLFFSEPITVVSKTRFPRTCLPQNKCTVEDIGKLWD